MSSLLKDLENILDSQDDQDMLESQLDHLLLDYKTQVIDFNTEDKLNCISENNMFFDQY